MDDIDQDDIDDAAWNQFDSEWQDELTCDPGYFAWLAQLAAEAASRTEMNNGDYSKR